MSDTKVRTNGGSQRFADTPLTFGMDRFTSARMGEERTKWFFSVQRYIGRDVLIEVEATLPMFREMQRFIERAITDLESDGGRREHGEGDTA